MYYYLILKAGGHVRRLFRLLFVLKFARKLGIVYIICRVKGMVIGMEKQFDKISLTDNRRLIRMALEAREKAYTPYSGYKVGAALLAKDGTVYTGCNIENAGYTPTNCAERTAFFKAVSEGERDFAAIAVVGGYEGEPVDYAYPCGVCRQVMMEFCDPGTFRVITAVSEEDYLEKTLEEMLPYGFGPKNIDGGEN